MRVHELMTREVEACKRQTDLAAVAMIMWRRDCGVVPVVDEEERLTGILTDRDICMAVATRHLRPEEIEAGDAMTRRVFSVRPDDSVRLALQIMRNERVRRLPVVEENRILAGMVSINDIIQHTRIAEERPDEPLMSDVLAVLQTIGRHRTPPLRTIRREKLVPIGV